MRIVSGIQPSGELHIGNYFGALKQFIQLQEEHECFFFIADLHALTETPDADTLRKATLESAIAHLALGLDPQRVVLFVQSAVPAHTEGMWLLASLTPVGELERMTQYKDKAHAVRQRGTAPKESARANPAGQTRNGTRNHAEIRGFVNAGLLAYPVLMAADILLYRAESVPVGEDQKQHLELTRRLARRFNERYGVLFPEPKGLLPKTGARIMSLSDPKKKMSKSHGPEAAVGIFDEPDVIARKIKRAVTDSGKTVSYDPKRKPALANLLDIYALTENENPKAAAKRFDGKGYAELKTAVAQRLADHFAPFRERRQTLLQSPAHVRAVLGQGLERARAVSQETLREMRVRMGLS